MRSLSPLPRDSRRRVLRQARPMLPARYAKLTCILEGVASTLARPSRFKEARVRHVTTRTPDGTIVEENELSAEYDSGAAVEVKGQ